MMAALHGYISDSPTLNFLYKWALSLLCPVLSLNRITCAGLFSLWRLSDWLQVRCCCFHFFPGEGFDDGLFIGVRGVSVLLVHLASFPGKPVCLFISLLESTARLGLCRLQGQPGQLRSFWLRSFWQEFWSLLRAERASVKMTSLCLVVTA